MKIRSHLLILVLSTLLPILALSVIISVIFWREQRWALEQRYLERVRAISVALDRELEGYIRALQILAESPALQAGDLRSFYDQAVRVLSCPKEVTGYREVRYPKQDKVREQVEAELTRQPAKLEVDVKRDVLDSLRKPTHV